MTAPLEETPQSGSLERRVRRLEDAHASMEKSIAGLGTQMALAEQEQRHMRELMDTRFNGIEATLVGVGSKVDTMTGLLQSQSTDPQGSVINREVASDIADLKSKVSNHDEIIQRGMGAGFAFKAIALSLGAVGSFTGVLGFLHMIGVIR